MTRKIAYWVTTLLVALALASGGVSELTRPPRIMQGMQRVGYTDYFVAILGVWKLLGTLAILIPRFPRLKEWAYAGIFFDFTGASMSHAASQDYGPGAFHIIVPLILAGLAVASWAT